MEPCAKRNLKKQLHKKYKYECNSKTSSHKITLVELTCDENQSNQFINQVFIFMAHL